jgi:hypothetical protein
MYERSGWRTAPEALEHAYPGKVRTMGLNGSLHAWSWS